MDGNASLRSKGWSRNKASEPTARQKKMFRYPPIIVVRGINWRQMIRLGTMFSLEKPGCTSCKRQKCHKDAEVFHGITVEFVAPRRAISGDGLWRGGWLEGLMLQGFSGAGCVDPPQSGQGSAGSLPAADIIRSRVVRDGSGGHFGRSTGSALHPIWSPVARMRSTLKEAAVIGFERFGRDKVWKGQADFQVSRISHGQDRFPRISGFEGKCARLASLCYNEPVRPVRHALHPSPRR